MGARELSSEVLGGKKLYINNDVSTVLSDDKLCELFVKTGTAEDSCVLTLADVKMLEAMDNLRSVRQSRLNSIGNEKPACWSNRSSWGPAGSKGRALILGGSCSGSCPNLGWGDPLCFNLRDINQNMSSNHLTGNISHVGTEINEHAAYSYRVRLNDGVVVRVESQEPFSESELKIAACEIQKMVLDPMKEEEIVLNNPGRKPIGMPLPSSGPAIQQVREVAEAYNVLNELDNSTQKSVFIRELIPGVKAPTVIQIVQEFPPNGATPRYDHEFSPTIREPWMELCSERVMNKYDYSKVDLPRAVVNPSCPYPNLSALSPNSKISGEKFIVNYSTESGVVTSISAKKPKYIPEEDGKKVTIDGNVFRTNIVQRNIPDLNKKYILKNKRRVYIERDKGWMVPILYSILFVNCLIPFGMSAFICGDDKHGTLWSPPDLEDCKTASGIGKTVEMEVFNKEYDYNMTVYRCYSKTHIDVTNYGFFGPKSHIGTKVIQEPIGVSECKSLRDTKMYGGSKLVKVSETSWSTKNTRDIKYEWCCKDIETVTVNIFLEEAFVRVHLINGYAIMISSDADISQCSYLSGNHTSKTSTYIWDVKNVDCDIVSMGTSTFTLMPDGHIVSYDLQLSLMAADNVAYCGINYTNTEQGILIREVGRSKRDVDAAEKNYILSASQEYARKLYDNNYLTSCVLDRIVGHYLLDMSRHNPSRYVRAYFGRNDIAAKYTGDTMLIWECKDVLIIQEMRGHKYKGICYDMMPVKYEYDRDERLGFMDGVTGEIVPVSGSHDCNSVSGYLIYDDEWRKYYDDVTYDVMHSIQKMPSNTVNLQVKEISFVNNHLHSVFGPSGSKYREALASDLISLSGKHLIDGSIECNEEFDSRIIGLLKDAKEALRYAIFWPIKLVLLTVVALIMLFFILRYGLCCRLKDRIHTGYLRIRYHKEADNVEIS